MSQRGCDIHSGMMQPAIKWVGSGGRVETMPMSSQSRSLRLDEVESTVQGDSTELIYTLNKSNMIMVGCDQFLYRSIKDC
jgi:hypothetical protein